MKNVGLVSTPKMAIVGVCPFIMIIRTIAIFVHTLFLRRDDCLALNVLFRKLLFFLLHDACLALLKLNPDKIEGTTMKGQTRTMAIWGASTKTTFFIGTLGTLRTFLCHFLRLELSYFAALRLGDLSRPLPPPPVHGTLGLSSAAGR